MCFYIILPEGFDYYNISESAAGFAVFFRGILYVAVIDKIMEEGHSIPYPEGYYHAEAYLKENVPTAGVVSKMAYLFLCNKS